MGESRVMVHKVEKLGEYCLLSFKAVASPVKLFDPRQKGITFK